MGDFNISFEFGPLDGRIGGVLGACVIVAFLAVTAIAIRSGARSAVRDDLGDLRANVRAAAGDLKRIRTDAHHVRADFGKLNTLAKAELRTDRTRSAIHTAVGTVLGLLFGLTTDWILRDQGQWFPFNGRLFVRGATVTLVGLLIALILPWVAHPPMDALLRRIGSANRDEEGPRELEP